MTKGFWISLDLLHDKNTTMQEKLLLVEITQLSMLDKGCIASNNHFAELLQVKKESISRSISSLENKGYITTKIKDGSRNHERVITINKMLFEHKQNVIDPLTNCLETKENKTINKTINLKNKKEQLISILKEKDLTNINKKSLHEWLEYKEWNYKELGINKIIGLLKQYSFLEQEEIVSKSIISNYKGLFGLNKNISNNQPQEQYQSKAEKTKSFIEDYYKRKAEATQNSNADIIDGEVLS